MNFWWPGRGFFEKLLLKEKESVGVITVTGNRVAGISRGRINTGPHVDDAELGVITQELSSSSLPFERVLLKVADTSTCKQRRVTYDANLHKCSNQGGFVPVNKFKLCATHCIIAVVGTITACGSPNPKAKHSILTLTPQFLNYFTWAAAQRMSDWDTGDPHTATILGSRYPMYSSAVCIHT